MRLSTMLLPILFFAKSIFGWGPQGHEIIASFAQSINTQPTIDKYTSILNGSDLASISNWADQIKDELPWSADLHYIDTPDKLCNYDRKRDCIDERCVSGAITNYTKQLVTSSEIALKFVVHFVGDIHQPLHVGFTSDRGGNTIKVTFFSKHYNLHAVWDTAIIEKRLLDFDNSIEEYTKYLVNNISICDTDVSFNDDKWASESIMYACGYAYNISSHSLGEEYYERSLPVVEIRLAQAGKRLAAILEEIL